MSKTIYRAYGIEVLDNGKILLTRCPKCKRENYLLNVQSGICTWCGYDAHQDPSLNQQKRNEERN